jgi:hypothetical protein
MNSMCTEVSEVYRCLDRLHLIDIKAWVEQCKEALKANNTCIEQKIDSTTIFLDKEHCRDCMALENGSQGKGKAVLR